MARARRWITVYAGPMRTYLQRLSLLLVLGTAAISCLSKSAPRRDLVLVLAGMPPKVEAAPTYAALLQTGVVFEGPLRHAKSPLAAPFDLGLRIEVFTGRFDKDHQTEVWQELPTLGEAARLSGRHAFGLSAPGGIATEQGFDEFRAPGDGPGLTLCATPGDIKDAYSDAVQALEQRAERAGFERGRLFAVADMGTSASSADLEAFLQRLGDSDVAIYFTDPASATRLVIRAQGHPEDNRQEAVDPRDLYPTLARIARIPVPGILQGTNLLP